jgi:hypothetical protein
VIRHRHIESRRKEMAMDAQETIATFQTGQLKPQPLDEIIAELRQALNEASDE